MAGLQRTFLFWIILVLYALNEKAFYFIYCADARKPNFIFKISFT